MATLEDIKCKGINGKHYCDDPVQPPENFNKHPHTKNGKIGYCKTCQRGYDQDRYCPETNRDRGLRKRYGIGLDDYGSMLNLQGGGCKVCGWVPPEGKELCVDHCHDTDEVRGLLCNSCNAGLGMFRDNPEALFSAVAYLECTGSAKESDPVWHPNPLVTEDPEAYFDVAEVLDIVCLRAEGGDLI